MLIRCFPTLNSMLDLRADYLEAVLARNPEPEVKDANDPVVLALRDKTPQHFENFYSKLEDMIELSRKAEHEFQHLKTLKQVYDNAVANGEPDEIQKATYKAMVNYKLETFNPTWDALVAKLPMPNFEALKTKLQTLGSDLGKANHADREAGFLTFCENEKKLNEEFLKIVEERCVFIKGFKAEMNKLQGEVKVVGEVIKGVVHASVERHANNVQVARENAQRHTDNAQIARQKAKQHADNAQIARQKVKQHADDAQIARQKVKQHADNAQLARQKAKQHADNAQVAREEANIHKSNASAARQRAEQHRNNAKIAAESAQQHSDNAIAHLKGVLEAAKIIQPLQNEIAKALKKDALDGLVEQFADVLPGQRQVAEVDEGKENFSPRRPDAAGLLGASHNLYKKQSQTQGKSQSNHPAQVKLNNFGL